MNIAIVDDLSSESDALRNILNEYAAINRLTFSIHAYDYIEKPTKRDKLFRVMDDILENDNRLS